MQLTSSFRCRKVGPSECGKQCLGFLQLNPGTVSRCVNHCQEETSDSLHQEKKHLTPQTQLLVHGSWQTCDIRGAKEPGPQKTALGCFWVSSYFDSEAEN